MYLKKDTINEDENQDLSQYLEDYDYALVFFDMLRDYAFSKNPNLKKNINMSFLMSNFLDDFMRHHNITKESLRYTGSSRVPETIGRELFEKGLYDLYIYNPDEKFTQKFGTIIQKLIKTLNIPSDIGIDFTEETPNEIEIMFSIPYSELVKKSESEMPSYSNIFSNTYRGGVAGNKAQKLISLIYDWFNLKKGRPITGGVEISAFTNLKDRESWTKLFLKDLRAKIKNNSELNERIKAIKLTEKGPRNDIDVILKDPSQYESWSRKSENRVIVQNIFDSIKKLISSEGLNLNLFNIDSPTWRRHF